MSNQEPSELDEILDKLAVRMYDEGQLDKPSLMGRQVAIVNINYAKQAIQSLIDRKVAEARIDELKACQEWFVKEDDYNDDGLTWQWRKFDDRIQQLTGDGDAQSKHSEE